MDGVIGLIVFALISFAYNKLVERANKKNTPKNDLDEWLAPQEGAGGVKKPMKAKKTAPKIIQKQSLEEKFAEKYDKEKQQTDLSQSHQNTELNQSFDKSYQPQSIKQKDLTDKKIKSRNNLKIKNRKTLRQAFILNTILSKPKSYEP